MALSDGDILSALQSLNTDTSKISQTISDMSERDIHQIQQDLETLVRISQGTSRTAENDRFQRERDQRARDRQNRQTNNEWRYSRGSNESFNRSSQGTSRYSSSNRSSSSRSRNKSSFSGSFKSQFDGVVDEFFGSIGEGIKSELKKSLADSPFHKQIKGYIKKFADDLGIKVSDIPSAIGRDLGKNVIRNTRFGQRITSTLRGFEDRVLNGAINGARRSTNEYARNVTNDPNATFSDIYEQIVQRFKRDNPRGSEDAEPSDRTHVPPTSDTPGASDNLVSLVSQINDSVFAILRHLDSDAADKVKDSARKPQGERRGSEGQHPEGPEGTEGGTEEGPDIPDASNMQGESQRPRDDYDPDLDMYNNIKDRAKGLYDKLPDSIKSRITGKYGKYIKTIKGWSNKVGSKINSFLGSTGGEAAGAEAGAMTGEAAAGAETSSLALGGSTGGSMVAAGGEAAVASEGVAAGGTAMAGTAGGAGAAGAAGAASGGLAALGPYALVAVAAIIAVTAVINKMKEALGPAIEGIKQFKEAAKKITNRYYESQKEMLKEEQKRIKADIETIAELPFKIMTDAAQKWYDAWDNNLKTIGQTQGYNKSDVQTLFSSYAERLRSEGLTSVISAADISSSLGDVIKSGLSGKIAEEFAYQATLLNNAIPNQDFFGYAETYGQIAGNAMARGLSEDAAIGEATSQLQQFASNLIYAGRNISSGITTALKDGSQLFADAVKIANTARTGDSTQISGVLTAVAAEIGAIAPDLSSELVSNVVQAAVGGNSSQLVALRSMAGIGASNTTFLKELATNPQRVFANVFSNLAKMQNLNNDNYMEVAESLSETFGISAAAFSRVDFEGLAQAISSMQVNNAALSENLSLLSSGDTTTSAEMLRMQQINQTILDEGLAYVLDSEAGRAIQEHMWNQELANEIMEREYSVDFAGSAKEMIQGIFETIHNILKFLNPFSWIGDLVNLAATTSEYYAQKADIASVLEAGKVGTGNTTSFRNLTNYNGSALNSVPTLMEMMGLFSSYSAVHGGLNAFNSLFNSGGHGIANWGAQSLGNIGAALSTAMTVHQSGVSSKYSWGFVGKSIANAIANTPMSAGASSSKFASSSAAINEKETDNINNLLSTMDEYVQAHKSYDTWKSDVTKQYKLTDFDQALSKVGLSEAEVRGQFEGKESQEVSKRQYEREEFEMEFWKEARNYYTVDFPYYSTTQLERMQTQIDLQTDIKTELIAFHTEAIERWDEWVNTTWKKEWVETAWKKEWIADSWMSKFLSYWTDIYVKFDTYSKSTHNAYKAIDEVKTKNKEKESGDAVLALAQALTDNTADLKDPTIQTNALLAQILIVAEAILQAENTSGGASLQTSLSALGLGLTTQDTTTGADTTATT